MGDAPASPAGKRRRGDDDGCAGLRRVAEIVMVLAAAGEVRGGREPTPAERALAAEARERLAAAVAEGAVRPKDLFPGEAVRAVVEDLGLNRAKDPAALGFRPTKASIADRLMLTKRKMEEVKEIQAQPTICAPQSVVPSGMSEFQGLHGASKFGVGAPRNQPAVAAMAGTAPLNSASLVTLKPGSSPVKPVTNSSAVALPHTGPQHLKFEKDVNGSSNAARNGGASVQSTKSTQDISARSNINAVQSSNQLLKNQDTKPMVVQAATCNPVAGHRAAPGTGFVPTTPNFANHNDIAISVQQFLHQATNHPSWTPPSTEYMQSRLECQICRVSIMDADSLLVCDACERGVHMNCLQQFGSKGVPKAEWHCSACLAQSRGKPLPPKYGKVTRTVMSSKAVPPVAGAQFSVQGSAEEMAAKENHQKLAVNGNYMKPISTRASNTVHNSNVLALSATMPGSHSQLASTLRPSIGNAIKVETSSNGKEGTSQVSGGTIQHNIVSPPNKRLRSSVSLSSADSANNTTVQGKEAAEISGIKCQSKSFAAGCEEKIKPEARSVPHPRRDEDMADVSGTTMIQTGIVATEEKPRNAGAEENIKSEAHSEPHLRRDEDMVDVGGTSMIQTGIVATEEKPRNAGAEAMSKPEAHSEPHPRRDEDIVDSCGTSMTQIGIVGTEEKSKNAGAEAKSESEAHSEPHLRRDEEIVDSSGTSMIQTGIVGTEEKPKNAGAEAKSESEAHSEPHPRRDEDIIVSGGTSMIQTGIVGTEEMPRNTMTSIDQGSSFTAEENLPREAVPSEPQTINDVEMASDTGIPNCQSSNIAIVENLPADAACEPQTINDVEMASNIGIPNCQSSDIAIVENLPADEACESYTKDMEMSTSNAPAVDESNNLANEQEAPVRTSSVSVIDFSSYAAIPTDQSQHANGLTENGIKEPSIGEAYKEKVGSNAAASDHDITPKVAENGVLHSEDGTLYIHENDAVGISAEEKQETSYTQL